MRRATLLDIEPIVALVETVVAETYTLLFDCRRVPKPDPSEPWATAWVAEDRQHIVGVGLAINDWIDDLWISKSHRGHGVGATILAHLESQIAENAFLKAGLRVVASNVAAREFYRRHGWIEVERYSHERWGFEMIDLSKDLTVDGWRTQDFKQRSRPLS